MTAGENVRERQHAGRFKRTPIVLAFVFSVLYVASIGPLAGLEGQEYGSPRFWKGIKVVYFPVFWTWKHGPEWWASSLEYYVRAFPQPSGRCGLSSYGLYEFALNNDAWVYRFSKRAWQVKGLRQPQLELELQRLDRDLQKI